MTSRIPVLRRMRLLRFPAAKNAQEYSVTLRWRGRCWVWVYRTLP